MVILRLFFAACLLATGLEALQQQQHSVAIAELMSEMYTRLGREACYAPPGGVMSPSCMSHTSAIGTDGSYLYYQIEGPDSFNLCCDGYGQGGWHNLGCDHGSFKGRVPLGATALTPQIRCRGVGGWGTFGWDWTSGVGEAVEQPKVSQKNVKTTECPDSKWGYNFLNDRCYYFSPSNPETFRTHLSWDDANKWCNSFKANLISINDAGEQKFVDAFASDYIQWIGGFRDGVVWKWIDGSHFDYTNWDHNSGQPKCDLGSKVTRYCPMLGIERYPRTRSWSCGACNGQTDNKSSSPHNHGVEIGWICEK